MTNSVGLAYKDDTKNKEPNSFDCPNHGNGSRAKNHCGLFFLWLCFSFLFNVKSPWNDRRTNIPKTKNKQRKLRDAQVSTTKNILANKFGRREERPSSCFFFCLAHRVMEKFFFLFGIAIDIFLKRRGQGSKAIDKIDNQKQNTVVPSRFHLNFVSVSQNSVKKTTTK